MTSQLDWPMGLPRTEDRKSRSKFDTNFNRTERELGKQMRLLGVEEWRLEHVTGSSGDPGVALYWVAPEDDRSGPDDDGQRAVGVDKYTNKRDNIRELYHWVKEMRMADQRAVKTGRDTFATAALPSGDEEAEESVDPFEVLPVAEEAPEEAIRLAADEYLKASHPDNGGDPTQFEYAQRVREAVDEELSG